MLPRENQSTSDANVTFTVPQARHSKSRGNIKTTQEEWLNAAIDMLKSDGSAGVKVDKIAQKLNVTRGGFYWFFKNRNELLEKIIHHWADPANDVLTATLSCPKKQPMEKLISYVKMLTFKNSFDCELDMAIRNWSRTDSTVKLSVLKVDTRRIEALSNIFQALGEEKTEAFIRARIYYFHQIGHYALDMQEPMRTRLELLPIYFRQLTGRPFPDTALEEIRAEVECELRE